MTRRIFCKVLLVVVAIFALLVISGVLSAQGRSEEAFERVREVQERHTDKLMARRGVVGTAVGLADNGEYAVLVLLEVPGVAGIPDQLEGTPVRRAVTGKIHALVDPTARFPRPVPTGVSTGHPDITAGTIGCRVTDGTNVYALSNNHVYANENLASIGDNVLQPGTHDYGVDPDDAIGTLYDYERIKFWGPRNTIDAAIALCSTETLGNSTPGDEYGTPSSVTTGAYIGQAVQKYGRTTGLTHGVVDAVNANVWVGYDSGSARFVKQIIIIPGGFSAGGDSGSLIVTDDSNCNPVGLLFAGSSTITVANPIDLVLSRFGVSVDDSAEGPVHDPPVADFSGSPTSGDAPLTVNFTDLSTEVPTDWSWDFGDSAGTSTAQNPSYTYNTPGAYTVALTATNAYGSDSETKVGYITVTEQTGNPPTADFSASTTSGEVSLTVNFTDLSSGNPTSWSWNFGGGGNSMDQNPSYTYNTAGTFTVSLTATNVDGSDTETKVDYITVSTPPSGVMHVASIDIIVLEPRTAGRNTFTKAQATVTIFDASNDPVEGATVYGHWSGATSDSDSGVTDSSGEVTLSSNEVKNASNETEFIFTVDDVVKSGWIYP